MQVSWGAGGFCVEHIELELQGSTGCFPLLVLISNTSETVSASSDLAGFPLSGLVPSCSVSRFTLQQADCLGSSHSLLLYTLLPLLLHSLHPSAPVIPHPHPLLLAGSSSSSTVCSGINSLIHPLKLIAAC